MRGSGSIAQNLTYAWYVGGRQTVFLTLITLITIFSTYTHADPVSVAAEEAAAKARAGQITGYLRTQGMQSLGLLPDEVKQAAKWFSNDWHQLKTGDETSEDTTTTALVDGSVHNEPRFFNLETTFHHKGFLPTHDAMLMGMRFQKNIFGDKIGLSQRNYYGQGWHSLQGYYGTEIAMDIAKRDDDGMPWGKIALGYVGGTDSMTDNGRGAQLRGDVNLTRGFQFTSGVEKDSNNNTSPYMMVSWKMKLD